jgi:predicted porin
MFNLGEFSMKKTLVALAALAATASFAQSSVTLFGVADVWVGQAKGAFNGTAGCPSGTLGAITGAAPTGACRTGINGDPSELRLDSGGLSGSRWGLRGTEDLGGGLKANFVIEAGVNVDNGSNAQGGLIYGRQSYVGLNGGFGDVRLGRQYSAYDELRGATSALGHTSFDATIIAGSWARTGFDYTGRVDNMIRYATPNLGGFTVALGYGLGENKNVSNGKAGSILSLHGLYANGPITVGVAHQSEKARATGGANAVKLDHTLIAGGYDFGAFKLSAGFNQSKGKNVVAGTTPKDTEYHIGGSIPVGALSLGLQYSNAKTKAAGQTVEKGSTFAAQGIYALSKRTDTYVGLHNTKIKDPNNTVEKSNLIAVGVRHRF